MPWIDAKTKWGYFQRVGLLFILCDQPHAFQERNEIVAFIEEHGLASKMIIVSGDAHMLGMLNEEVGCLEMTDSYAQPLMMGGTVPVGFRSFMPLVSTKKAA